MRKTHVIDSNRALDYGSGHNSSGALYEEAVVH